MQISFNFGDFFFSVFIVFFCTLFSLCPQENDFCNSGNLRVQKNMQVVRKSLVSGKAGSMQIFENEVNNVSHQKSESLLFVCVCVCLSGCRGSGVPPHCRTFRLASRMPGPNRPAGRPGRCGGDDGAQVSVAEVGGGLRPRGAVQARR